jgi:hypothetical protein
LRYILKENAFSKFEKNNSAPVMIFTDEEKRKAWERLDPVIKKGVMANLNRTCRRPTNEMSIDTLCNVVIDLAERIELLEKVINNLEE